MKKYYVRMLQKMNNIEYSEKIVAFIDLLGYGERVKKSESPHDLILYNLLLNQLISNVEDMCELYPFSDCVYVVSEKDNYEAVFRFIAVIAYQLLVQPFNIKMDQYDNSKVEKGFLIRGGITCGKIASVLEYNTIFGPAVVYAYELESKVAKFPRVIIDHGLVEMIPELSSYSWISRDSDDNMYFDYLDFLKKQLCDDDRRIVLHRVLNWLIEEKEIETRNNNDSIIHKIAWMEGYIKDFLSLSMQD